jgi:hypothetical protein
VHTTSEVSILFIYQLYVIQPYHTFFLAVSNHRTVLLHACLSVLLAMRNTQQWQRTATPAMPHPKASVGKKTGKVMGCYKWGTRGEGGILMVLVWFNDNPGAIVGLGKIMEGQ